MSRNGVYIQRVSAQFARRIGANIGAGGTGKTRMERFYKTLKDPKPFTLVFPHIPKTGGTSLLYHFRKHLGDNHTLSYGPHNRNVRFFTDLPQLEEMDSQDRAKLRVLQGHAVSEAILPLLDGEDIRLLIVLRHPVPLTRSRFNHKHNALAARGTNVTSERFLTTNRNDFMSRLLLSKFRSFIDESAGGKRAKVISILQKFDYVLTTEQLDPQTVGLMTDLQVPAGLERRRVAEKKTELEISDAGIAESNRLDMAIFEGANKVLPPGPTHNPFGFDAEGRARALERIIRDAPPEEEWVDHMYSALARALCKELWAEAALEKLSRPEPVAVADRARLIERIEARWAEVLPETSKAKRKLSTQILAQWRRQHPA